LRNYKYLPLILRVTANAQHLQLDRRNPERHATYRHLIQMYYDSARSDEVHQTTIRNYVLGYEQPVKPWSAPVVSPLALFLARIELGKSIPEKLYVAVAEVIAFAYRLDGKWPGR
jgi:hypothetical protein